MARARAPLLSDLSSSPRSDTNFMNRLLKFDKDALTDELVAQLQVREAAGGRS